jgi:hypothetical protein
MTKFALYVPLEAKPGKEKEVADFLRSAVPLVNAEVGTISWFANCVGENVSPVSRSTMFAEDLCVPMRLGPALLCASRGVGASPALLHLWPVSTKHEPSPYRLL